MGAEDFISIEEQADILAAAIAERLADQQPAELTPEEEELVDEIVEAIRQELSGSGGQRGSDEVLNADRVDASDLAEEEEQGDGDGDGDGG